jgi:hypothetical protein
LGRTPSDSTRLETALEHPDSHIWAARRLWFEQLFDTEQRLGGYVIGEHATALLVDLQAVYCAGAFLSTVIVACTIVDAHLREAELPDFEGGLKAAFRYSKHVADLEWLRRRRNALVHFKGADGPVVTVDDPHSNRDEHEREAQQAIDLVASVLFENPWT